ncbi:hypothetical protein H6761_01385 [Candidatus Nomurabacteria bacterium]|nr:hypothetical protein [Candidatus Nomurabacteria bacterium]
MQIEFLNLVIDLSPLFIAADKGPIFALWYIIAHGGWIPLAWILITQGYEVWIMEKQNKWFDTNKFVLLAVDIPKEHEQTPKAVEGLFSTVSGAHANINKVDQYVKGIFQLAFSFEIVSIDGYVQFLIRTPVQYRDVIESSIYSQYPDAEITEVDDYVNWAPEEYPDEDYNIWGTEVVLVKEDALPIRTYPAFEDKVSGEYKDPLAALLETMSKIHIGEQVWLQIIVRPTGVDWIKKSEEAAYKIAGKKMPDSGGNKATQSVDFITNAMDNIGEFIFPLWKEAEKKKDDMPSLMLHLTPGEKGTLEAIENKAGKIGFDCKIRLVYLSPNEDYNPNRVVSSVFGAIKQFSTLDLNSFKPDAKTKTSTNYWFTKYRNKKRKAKIIKAYKGRSTVAGYKTFILNTEELASLWHFPGIEVRTPLLKRTDTKKGEAPSGLPISMSGNDNDRVSQDLKIQLNKKPDFNVNLDNDYFEEKFAKNKEEFKQKQITKQLADKKGEPPTNLPTG